MPAAKPGDYVLKIGKKFRDQTLDSIGRSDEGLEYLDWLVGQPWLMSHVRDRIEAFLGQDTVKNDLDRIFGD